MLTVIPTETSRGILRFKRDEYPCSLGHGGVRTEKHEGDGATPIGTFRLRQVFYRPDKLEPPATSLPIQALTQADGWCDAPSHPDYNKAVNLPFEASHETLWREDGLYDIIIVVGYNDDPPRPGLGSAIFVHCATADFSPTEGCVALERGTLIGLLPHLDLESALQIVAT